MVAVGAPISPSAHRNCRASGGNFAGDARALAYVVHMRVFDPNISRRRMLGGALLAGAALFVPATVCAATVSLPDDQLLELARDERGTLTFVLEPKKD